MSEPKWTDMHPDVARIVQEFIEDFRNEYLRRVAKARGEEE